MKSGKPSRYWRKSVSLKFLLIIFSIILTYNIDSEKEEGVTMRNTISIHRKKHTNTLYTINALNEIVSLLNDGKMDADFEVDWEKFRNTLLVTDDDGLKKISNLDSISARFMKLSEPSVFLRN